nr:pre-coat protein [Papaya leaf curl Haveri virus]
MWDPLVHELLENVLGLRCMLAVQYLQQIENTYSPVALGYDLIRGVISVIRAKNYVQATSRYNHFNARIEGTPPSQLRQPLCHTRCCPRGPRLKGRGMAEQAHGQQAPNVQDV